MSTHSDCGSEHKVVTTEDLVFQQTDAMRSVERALENFRKIGKAKFTLGLVRNRLLNLKDNFARCQRLHDQLLLQADDEEIKTIPYFKDRHFIQCEDAFMTASDFMSEILVPLETPPTTSSAHVSDNPSPPVRSSFQLPQIQLPVFSGNFQDWESFRDRFNAMIVRNADLTRVAKMHYLTSSVSGEASEILRHLAITDANFDIAWKLLTSRYENKRRLVSEHLHALHELPKITIESALEIRTLRDKANMSIQALRNLDRSVDTWDDMLVYLVTRSLDPITRKAWELKLGDNVDYPSYADLDKFLEARVRALEAIPSSATATHKRGESFSNFVKSRHINTHAVTSTALKCPMCQSSHFISQCATFKEKPVSQRFDLIKKWHRCVNCFSSKHTVSECSNQFTCRKCHKRHHTLLHLEKVEGIPASIPSTLSPRAAEHSQSPAANPSTSEIAHTHLMSKTTLSNTRVLLATAWIEVRSTAGRASRVRALLDQGSVATLITENLAQRLRAPRQKISMSIVGIGGVSTSAKHAVTISVAASDRTDPAYSTTAVVLPSVTRYVPDRIETNPAWSHLRGLPLADTDPMSSDPIDIIIGSDLYGLLILEGVRKGSANEPIAQNSIFGWFLSGPVTNGPINPSLSIPSHHIHLSDNLDAELRQFWEIEELPRTTYLTAEEQKCEEHFVSTHSRDSTGRYVVRLPFRDGPPINIGDSYTIAKAMLLRTEKRLNTNPDLSSAYATFLTDYEKLGHMTRVPATSESNAQTVYLPHHAVFKQSSTTSSTRIVFNASSITSNKTSLNDHMMIGPKLQTDLSTILLRWQKFKYVLTADVAKMYRQILIDPRDRDYQRILWRSSPVEPIDEFQLLTVTYGTASAPYLALRVLQQLANDDGAQYPLARNVLRRHIYIDDCVFGADDQRDAILVRDQLVSLLRRAGLELRKWASNARELISDISPTDHGLALDKPLAVDEGLKILGISWNSDSDVFRFKVDNASTNLRTKRDILSTIAKIFDPLGWITPVVITAKIYMQNLWRLKSGWDDPLPTAQHDEWLAYYSQLSELKTLSLPRWIKYSAASLECEMHGFADASTLAYGAVVYLRVKAPSGEIFVSFLAAKSKVAPIKPLTIPRLELSAALLLARLMNFVRDALDLPRVSSHCWTDSTIVLAWLNKPPSHWKTFIANRVSEIQSRLSLATWHHVPTNDNPADCASRGMPVADFLAHSLWWRGPEWLLLTADKWPDQRPLTAEDAPLECKLTKHVHIAVSPLRCALAERYSSWIKLIRVTAYIKRFIANARQHRNSPGTKPGNQGNRALTTAELQNATIYWVKQIQTDLFPDEKNCLSQKLPIPRKSPLLALHPFLDDQGLIRVGGRLENSDLPANAKHPIILASHILVSLLITHIHIKNLHAGPQLTLRLLRDNYWVLRGRTTVRRILFACVTCTREKAIVPTELMGNLPESRVTRSSRPFVHCGVDYAGPILVRTTPGRGHKSTKAFIALFVCMASKAVHVELVSDYSSAAFIAAFHRFCSRRGLPTDMYSDNGTTFVGADRELATLFRAVVQDPKVEHKLIDDGITWHFIPPSAPHFGGLWEAGVRSVKYHFKRVVGSHTLTFEELATLLCQIEACLNSRPIAALSDRVDDFVALTPGHFLIGTALLTAPEPSLLEFKENRLSRWQLVRQMYERLWDAWSHDYLHTLQQRSKWRLQNNKFKIGQIVVLRNSLLPPCKWDLGRISACHPGPDGLIRVVTVRTAKSEFKRPISKICLLPVNLNEMQESTPVRRDNDTQANASL